MIEAIIKEGGTTRVFANRAKLEVSLQGGGTTFFVPESETRLTTKRIEKNGVYKASDDGDYGWSTVTVAVSTTDSVTGTGADGKEHNYSVDGSGALVDQVVPSEIRITTPPNYVGPYGDGAIISFDGIVVHAYDALGNDMGEVPFNELVFPVTVARYDAQADVFVKAMESDCETNWEQPILSYSSALQHAWNDKSGYDAYEEFDNYYPSAGAVMLIRVSSGNTIVVFFASASNEVSGLCDVRVRRGWIEGGAWQEYTDTIQEDGSHTLGEYTYNGKTVYWIAHGNQVFANNEFNPEIEDLGNPDGPTIWSAVFGTVTGTSGGVQIPVEWSRTGDGLVLDTSFGVSVVPGPSGSGEEGGNASAVIPIEI